MRKFALTVQFSMGQKTMVVVARNQHEAVAMGKHQAQFHNARLVGDFAKDLGPA